MGYKNLLIGFVLLAVTAVLPAEAATRKKPGSKKSVATSGKRLVSKGKASKSTKPRKVQTAVHRAPRQSEPTYDRYVEIQQALVDKGLHPGPATGQWGPEWTTALKEFQQSQNLKPDGKLGALSLIALGLGPKRDPMAQVTGKPEPLR